MNKSFSIISVVENSPGVWLGGDEETNCNFVVREKSRSEAEITISRGGRVKRHVLRHGHNAGYPAPDIITDDIRGKNFNQAYFVPSLNVLIFSRRMLDACLIDTPERLADRRGILPEDRRFVSELQKAARRLTA